MKKTAKYTLVILFLVVSVILFLGGGLGSRNVADLNNGKATLFAHRGVTSFAIENSIESFDKSQELGFCAIETDVNCTKDGKLILFHDKSCKRLLNLEADIDTLNWIDIKKKHLHHNGKKTTQRVISLEQFFEQINDSVLVYLDMKAASIAVADSLLLLIERHKRLKNIIIADEHIFFLAYLKFQKPAIKVSLEGFNKGKEILYYIIPKYFKPDFYSSFIDNIDKKHMLFLAENNLLSRRIVYGVDDKNMSKVLELGLHNIIFDYTPSNGSVKALEELLTKNKRH